MSNKDFVFSYSQDYATWLDERGYARPQVLDGNRLPRPAEVLAVLHGVAEGELEIWGPYAFLSPRDSGPRDGRWLTLEGPPRGTWDGPAQMAQGRPDRVTGQDDYVCGYFLGYASGRANGHLYGEYRGRGNRPERPT